MNPVEEMQVAEFLGHLDSAVSSGLTMVGLQDTAIINKIKARIPLLELVKDDIYEDFLKILKNRKKDASNS
jgi:hypothetical protein